MKSPRYSFIDARTISVDASGDLVTFNLRLPRREVRKQVPKLRRKGLFAINEYGNVSKGNKLIMIYKVIENLEHK